MNIVRTGIKDDVHINIYDNRIEVISPANLLAISRWKTYFRSATPVIRRVVRLLNKLPDPPNKDIGEGIDTAFRSMRDARLKPPVIEELDNGVRVVLRHEASRRPRNRLSTTLKKMERFEIAMHAR